MLKQKGFIMLENSLMALIATSYALVIFNCFYSIYMLFCFCVFSFFKIFWAYSFDLISDIYFIENTLILYLSRPINNQLWHARVGLFNN